MRDTYTISIYHILCHRHVNVFIMMEAAADAGVELELYEQMNRKYHINKH